jgi:hypothetical protein
MNGEQAEHPELGGEVETIVADKAVVEDMDGNPVIDAETQKAIDQFLLQNKQDSAPVVHVAPVASADETTAPAVAETVEAKIEREKKETVAEADLPATFTVRHTVESFMGVYGCEKLEAQSVLNFLARVNEAKRIKFAKQTGIGKGRRATVFAMSPTVTFGLEV